MSTKRESSVSSGATPSASSRRAASASSSPKAPSSSSMSASSARVRNMVEKSCRMSTSRQPSAEVMPGFGGTSTIGIDRSRARSAPCSGPAPPKTTSAKSRGS